jgi:hypothetical protein
MAIKPKTLYRFQTTAILSYTLKKIVLTKDNFFTEICYRAYHQGCALNGANVASTSQVRASVMLVLHNYITTN